MDVSLQNITCIMLFGLFTFILVMWVSLLGLIATINSHENNYEESESG